SILCLSCEDKKNDDDNSSGNNISISWRSSNTCTYSYSSGILSGQNCYVGFTVNSGSGNLKIEAKVTIGEGNEKSVEKEVVKGEDYIIVVPIKFSGTKNCAPGAVTNAVEITAGNSQAYKITIQCEFNGRAPKTLTIKELTI
ncbi:hypothetical protein ACFL0J_07280, partial [Candidatus Neomarinimicrobiota bacterium]